MSEQRDLKADLREWNSDLINGIRSTDWFYLAGEYIERALKAEKKNIESYDLLYGAFDKVKDEAEQLKADNATLREANDLQRHSIQQLSAQVVQLREVLDLIRIHFAENICHSLTCRWEYCQGDKCESYEIRTLIAKTLNTPNPGAKFLAVVEAAMERKQCIEKRRKIVPYTWDWMTSIQDLGQLDDKLNQALADLEGAGDDKNGLPTR